MLKVYNTLSRLPEEFKPINPSEIKIYHCGPTVYWHQHLGNLRGMTQVDLMFRGLEFLGYKPKLVRNYTDVGHLLGDNAGDADMGEDRMQKAAIKEGLTPQQIAQKYIDSFEHDCKELNILSPMAKPRATEYIEQIIDMVKILVDKGFAYQTPLAVYFDVTKFADYTKLSRQKIDFQKQGLGTGEITDSNKKHPADFALWFFKAGSHKDALQFWPSPFTSDLVKNGEGFPGWHIECSAMIKALLGNTIDIHIGGVEHISIHHTNEIAQSNCANGVSLANYWLHNEHLIFNGKKISKSDGTAVFLKDAIEKGFDSLDVRYFFLAANYRSKQNLTFEGLTASANALKKLRTIFNKLPNTKLIETLSNKAKEFLQEFADGLEDDFNFANCLAVVWNTINSKIADLEKNYLLIEFDKVLGLNLELERAKAKDQSAENIPTEISSLIEQRENARKNDNFKEADQIRNKIKNLGYEVTDTKEGLKINKL